MKYLLKALIFSCSTALLASSLSMSLYAFDTVETVVTQPSEKTAYAMLYKKAWPDSMKCAKTGSYFFSTKEEVDGDKGVA